MEFLEDQADGFELMLILDADSEMTPAAVLRLVAAMRQNPTLGIIQQLTVGLPASAAFPRLFQFGMRAGMRTWATALAWWQGDECVYWGHNAVERIAPFRAH
jgi:membrane glycosyltransferase